MSKKTSKLIFSHFFAAVFILAITETVLILGGILPPIMTYSFGNIVFALLKLSVLIYSSVYFYEIGVKKIP